MDNGLRYATVLLIAFAADGVSAESRGPGLKLQSMESVRFDEPAWTWRDPVLGWRLFQDDTEIVPSWNLPLGSRSNERDRRGIRFGVRPGRGLKGTAKIRF